MPAPFVSRRVLPELLPRDLYLDLGARLDDLWSIGVSRIHDEKGRQLFEWGRVAAVRLWAAAAGLLGDAGAFDRLLARVDDGWLEEEDDAVGTIASAAMRLAGSDRALRARLYRLVRHPGYKLREALIRWLDPRNPDERAALLELGADTYFLGRWARDRANDAAPLEWWEAQFSSDPLAGLAPSTAQRARPVLKEYIAAKEADYPKEVDTESLLSLFRRMPARARVAAAGPFLRLDEVDGEHRATVVQLIARTPGSAKVVADAIATTHPWDYPNLADALSKVPLPLSFRRALSKELLDKIRAAPMAELLADKKPIRSVAQALAKAWPNEDDPRPLIDPLVDWGGKTSEYFDASSFLGDTITRAAKGRRWVKPLVREALADGLTGKWEHLAPVIERLAETLSPDERHRIAVDALDRRCASPGPSSAPGAPLPGAPPQERMEPDTFVSGSSSTPCLTRTLTCPAPCDANEREETSASAKAQLVPLPRSCGGGVGEGERRPDTPTVPDRLAYWAFKQLSMAEKLARLDDPRFRRVAFGGCLEDEILARARQELREGKLNATEASSVLFMVDRLWGGCVRTIQWGDDGRRHDSGEDGSGLPMDKYAVELRTKFEAVHPEWAGPLTEAEWDEIRRLRTAIDLDAAIEDLHLATCFRSGPWHAEDRRFFDAVCRRVIDQRILERCSYLSSVVAEKGDASDFELLEELADVDGEDASMVDTAIERLQARLGVTRPEPTYVATRNPRQARSLLPMEILRRLAGPVDRLWDCEVRHWGWTVPNGLFIDGREALTCLWATSCALSGVTEAIPNMAWLLQDPWSLRSDFTEAVVAGSAAFLAAQDRTRIGELFDLVTKDDYPAIQWQLVDLFDPDDATERPQLVRLSKALALDVAKKAHERLEKAGALAWWEGAFAGDPLTAIPEGEARAALPVLQSLVPLREARFGSDSGRPEVVKLLATLAPATSLIAARLVVERHLLNEEDLAQLLPGWAAIGGFATVLCEAVQTWQGRWSRTDAPSALGKVAKALPEDFSSQLAREALSRLRTRPADETAKGEEPARSFAALVGVAWPASWDPMPLVELLIEWTAGSDKLSYSCPQSLRAAIVRAGKGREWVRSMFFQALAEDFGGRFAAVAEALVKLVEDWPADERHQIALDTLERGAAGQARRWAVEQLPQEEQVARFEDPVVRPVLIRYRMAGPFARLARQALRAGRLTAFEAAETVFGIVDRWGGAARILEDRKSCVILHEAVAFDPPAESWTTADAIGL